MGLKSFITDITTGMKARVIDGAGETNALVVATRPLKTFKSKTAFFTNDTYGREMAQDGSYTGNSWVIHDGADTTEADSGNCDGIGGTANKLKDGGKTFTSTVAVGMWVHNTTDNTYSTVTVVDGATELTLADDIMDDGEDYIIAPDFTFSEPAGTKWVEADGGRNNTDGGSASLKCDNPAVNDILQLANVNNEDIDLSNFAGITMWVNVDKDWKSGDSFSIYGMIGGSQAGSKVYLENYFDYDTYDVWQYINIPLTDMEIEALSIDAIRIENEAREGGKSPKFYLDDITLQSTGTAISYTVEPDKGTWLYIKTFQTTFVDAVSADNADSTMPQLSYDKFLAMTPTNGYVFRRYNNGESPDIEARITSLMDLVGQPNTVISNAVSDGTNTLITVNFTYPEGMETILKSEKLDKITMTIEDDFSQLLYFRISVQGYVETRN